MLVHMAQHGGGGCQGEVIEQEHGDHQVAGALWHLPGLCQITNAVVQRTSLLHAASTCLLPSRCHHRLRKVDAFNAFGLLRQQLTPHESFAAAEIPEAQATH